MTDTADQQVSIPVTVRYFAAARAAAGVDSETVRVAAGTTIADLVGNLRGRDPRLASVLDRCSYLRDGVAVRTRDRALGPGETVDVLPPFAGG